MSEEKKTSPITAFASYYVLTSTEAPEVLSGEQTLKFPVMTMDDWAECCAVLKSERRDRAIKQMSATVSQAEREFVLSRVDSELIPMSFAFNYRTETTQGIRSTLRKQLVKQFVSEGKSRESADEEAKQIVAKLNPWTQHRIARYLADPPLSNVSDSGNSGESRKNEDAASTSETGNSMPLSSENSGGSNPEA